MTRDEIVTFAKKSGLNKLTEKEIRFLSELANFAAKSEREECAKSVERGVLLPKMVYQETEDSKLQREFMLDLCRINGGYFASVIRARGQ